MAGIKLGEFFIVNGQIAYVAEVGEEFETDYDRRDSRLRVIYDNGTESDILLRSLQRALHRDETGRRVTDPDAGPLFDDEASVGGCETGTIYVLRSLSDHPEIASKRDVVHKIGVTGGDVDKRIAIADRDPTFLMAPAEIVVTYKLVDQPNRIRKPAGSLFPRRPPGYHDLRSLWTANPPPRVVPRAAARRRLCRPASARGPAS